MFFTSCKNKRGAGGAGAALKRDNKIAELNEGEIINQQKRALIIELLRAIIEMDNLALNDAIKPLIVHVYVQLQQIKHAANHKGILTLLRLYGNPGDIVDEIQQ
jgi:hypothetical protein